MLNRTFIFMCCLVLILLFGGCGKTKEVLTFRDFKSEVYITAGDTEYKGTVIFDGKDSAKVILSFPETVSGYEILCSSEGTTIKKDDIVTSLKQKNPFSQLRGILLYPIKQTIYISDDNKYILNGRSCTIETHNDKPVHVKTDDCEYSFYSVGNEIK